MNTKQVRVKHIRQVSIHKDTHYLAFTPAPHVLSSRIPHRPSSQPAPSPTSAPLTYYPHPTSRPPNAPLRIPSIPHAKTNANFTMPIIYVLRATASERKHPRRLTFSRWSECNQDATVTSLRWYTVFRGQCNVVNW